ncbi:MAG: Hsp33 family molecular chaperone HslO [Gammaproteobacteria bacterium]|nr:Hsp33 family molecular chaperone HslO [Gammaproteobacteria bacterium]
MRDAKRDAKQDDCLHRFLFDHSSVRGELVQLVEPWHAVLERQDYPIEIRQVLGEAFAAVALLAATVKFDGSLIMQTKGDGPLKMLVVECTGKNTLRGLAHWRGDTSELAFHELMGRGYLAITIDPGEGKDRYQGIVELGGVSLAACVERYFAQSEQLPTRLWLACDERQVAGLMLQKLPEQSAARMQQEMAQLVHAFKGSQTEQGPAEHDEDLWNRAVMLADTVTRDELLELPAAQVLHRLFHEETMHVFRSPPLRFACRCSRERVANVLKSLGATELNETLAQEGEITASCEFCNSTYRFDRVDVDQLLATGEFETISKLQH